MASTPQAGPTPDAPRSAHEALPAAHPPTSLYIHIPWCVRKCPYCDFNSHHLRGELPATEYVDALLEDLRLDLEQQPWPGGDLTSIFIGGGTPSLLPAKELDRLLEHVARLVPCPQQMEITLEANPGTVERGTFRELRAAGVNRVSLGIQSFDEGHLRDLGRIHDGEQADLAIREAQAHFERINLDLMYALPRQTLEGCLEDLARAIDYGTEHLSHYELTIEPNTVFSRYEPAGLPDEDLAGDMREASETHLARAGLRAYEVSAYARHDGARALHNLNYWSFGDYLAIGAGAHGKRSTLESAAQRVASITRSRKVRSPRAYLEAAGAPQRIADSQTLEGQALVGEFMLNALRLVGGFSEETFERRVGLSRELIRPHLEAAAVDGLLRQPVDGHWQPTSRGRAFLNDLQARFID
ncbi:MAG: radical SAM family heme chaperone HemW [Pseudomonadota bacterium]